MDMKGEVDEKGWKMAEEGWDKDWLVDSLYWRRNF